MLQVEDVSFQYGGKPVIASLSCRFAGNGLYALLAPNGEGKTTLIKLLLALLRPSSGSVRYAGENIQNIESEYNRVIGYAPQISGFYPSYTVSDMLRYMAALKGLDRADGDRDIHWAAEQLGLTKYFNAKMKTLSGGTVRRVTIAMALLGNPKIIFLDEPGAGQDVREREYIRNLLSELSEEKIIIFSTHIVSDIENIANQVLFLKDGAIRRSGTVGELLGLIGGKVREGVFTRRQVSEMAETRHIISKRFESDDRIYLRFIDEKDESAGAVRPTLDDLFLYVYGTERH